MTISKIGKFTCHYCEMRCNTPKIEIFKRGYLSLKFTKEDIVDIEHYEKQYAVTCTNCDTPNFVTDKLELVYDYLSL